MKLVGLLLEDVRLIKDLKKTHNVFYVDKLPAGNPIWHTYIATEFNGPNKHIRQDAYTISNNTEMMSRLQKFTSQAEQRLARIGFPRMQTVLVFTDSPMPKSGEYKVGESAAQYWVENHGILIGLKNLRLRDPRYLSTPNSFVLAEDDVSLLVHEHAHHFWYTSMSRESKDLFIAWYDRKIASVGQDYNAEELKTINQVIESSIEKVFFKQLLAIERLRLDKLGKIDKHGNPIESGEKSADQDGSDGDEEFEFADADDLISDFDPDDPENILPVVLKFTKHPQYMIRKTPPGPVVYKGYQSKGRVVSLEPGLRDDEMFKMADKEKIVGLSERIAKAISKFLAPLDFFRAVWGEDGEFKRMRASIYEADSLRDKATVYTKQVLDKFGDKIRDMVVRKNLYGPTANIDKLREKLMDVLEAPSSYSLSNPEELWAEIVEYCSRNQTRDTSDGVSRELKTLLYRVLSAKG
jgi:hypothetical protein